MIDQLYVHPAVARTGVASALVDAIEKLAAARGTATLVTDASDTAKPLFDARGYQAVQSQHDRDRWRYGSAIRA